MASLLFGILFRNPDAGECAQLGLETGTNHLYVRTTTGGDWSSWERVDGSGDASGSVIMSQMALKWSAPLTLQLTGAVTGSVSFDGSEGSVECAVTSNGDALDQGGVEDIARRIAGELIKEHERRYDHYNTSTGN